MWQAIQELFRALNGFMAQLWEMATTTKTANKTTITTTNKTTTKGYHEKFREQTAYERRQQEQEQERNNPRINSRMTSLTDRPCLFIGTIISVIFSLVSCFSFIRWLVQ
jgi:hypothetical protein